MVDVNFIQSPGSAQLFPLYIYSDSSDMFASKSNTHLFSKTENFTKEIRNLINGKYNKVYEPEQILGYIYSILYSQAYRTKYAEFLKIDFPRIPFCETSEQFETLSKLGWQLIQTHLMNEIPAYDIGQYVGEGNNEIVKPEYRKTKDYERLYINKTQYFDHVPENVYQFYIGGYQVLNKYLKDRKNRILTLSEVKTIRNIIKVLAFTIEQMQKIDEATKDWI